MSANLSIGERHFRNESASPSFLPLDRQKWPPRERRQESPAPFRVRGQMLSPRALRCTGQHAATLSVVRVDLVREVPNVLVERMRNGLGASGPRFRDRSSRRNIRRPRTLAPPRRCPLLEALPAFIRANSRLSLRNAWFVPGTDYDGNRSSAPASPCAARWRAHFESRPQSHG